MNERYDALDGLRGVAAICVVVFHFISMHPALQMGRPHGYLAVDFFFALSGFVVAKAYGAKIGKTLTLGGFIRLRLVRLYPTALAGVALGAVLMPINYPDSIRMPDQIIAAIVAGVVLLLPMHSAIANPVQFVIDTPLWSLSTELWANLGFALLARRASLAVWFTIMAGAAVIFVWLSTVMGSFEIGWGRGQYGAAIVRTAFSFSYGVVLAKLLVERRVRKIRAAAAFALAGALAMILSAVPTIPHYNRAFDLFCVAVILPAIVALGSAVRVGPMTKRICSRLGELSYPLYVFHYPLLLLATALTFGRPRALVLAAGAIAVLAAIAISWAATLVEPTIRERLSGTRRPQLPAFTLP